MELLGSLIDIVLHLDAHLLALAEEYGAWIYAILFAIIFAETGLIVAPFLPGDSLLFVIGALCGMGALKLQIAIPLLILAAFMGDHTNYWVGRLVGLRLLSRASPRLIRHEHLEKTRVFYERHGGKTVVLARFLPVIRTFAPFVAGIGTMNYRLYVAYSIIGGLSWIGSLVLAGYFFGNIPFVKDNLTLMVFVIIFVSFIPAIREFIRHRRSQPR